MAQSVEQERSYWEAVAHQPLDSLRTAIWNEPHIPGAWDTRVWDCMQEIVEDLCPALEQGGNVLDLGCGIGRLAFPLAQYFQLRHRFRVHIIGIDISHGMIDIARREMREYQIANVEFRVCDGRTLPDLPPLSAAYSMVTFQHLPRIASLSYIRQVGDRLGRRGRFRFQFVEGDEAEFLSHGLSIVDVEEACHMGGMDVIARDLGHMYPSWLWITAEKRDD